MSRYYLNLAWVLAMLTACASPQTTAPTGWTLANGMRVTLVPVSGSSNVSIFTYLPMGLATDAAGRSQWSHLIEHMLIRSTHPQMSQEVNAETLPDHMRLDFYGTRENWRTGLGYHAAWLQDLTFKQETLEKEKPQILQECDFTERNLATHKFAMAAWNQAVRHGMTQVSVRGDIERAELAAVQAYGDLRLAMISKTVVCIVGGVNEEEARTATAEVLGKLTAKGDLPKPGPAAPKDREVTWDLSTRHLIMAWQIPDVTQEGYAALYAAAAVLQMQFYNDPAIKQIAGNVQVSADLAAPEGWYFFINAPVSANAAFDEVRTAIAHRLSELQDTALAEIVAAGPQLAYQLTQVPNITMLQRQAPDLAPAMIEGNIGLQWGMREFQFGAQRRELADALAALTPDNVRDALNTHLTMNKAFTVTLAS